MKDPLFSVHVNLGCQFLFRSANANPIYSTAGALVFFMQAGFAMLEVGIVHPKNAANILFKNLIDASLVLTSLVLAYPPAIPFPT